MQLSTVLQNLLKERRLSLTKLAKESGIPVSTLHSWTTGKKTLNLEQLKKVSLNLKVPIHDLVWGCSDPFQKSKQEELDEIFHGDLRVTIHRCSRKSKSEKET